MAPPLGPLGFPSAEMDPSWKVKNLQIWIFGNMGNFFGAEKTHVDYISD